MKHLYLFILSLALFFLACNDDDLKADIPAFLIIDDVVLKTTPSQGSANDRITDVKVFINDASLGTYELPTVIPIRQIGAVNIKIRSVIHNSGQSNQRVDYPFYTTFVLDTVLNPREEIKIEPKVEYFSTVSFSEPWSGEDFESGVNFDFHQFSEATLDRLTDPIRVFEGNASGIARLEPSMEFFEAYTPSFSDIPRNGQKVYLELNYRSSHSFTVSVYTNNRSTQDPIISFRPRESWTKVYVDLSNVFSTLVNAFNFNLAIGYRKPIGEVGELYLDNIKLVHFR